MDDLSKPLVLNRVYHADALALLQALDDESVNCCVTSPPYFGLRSYLDGDAREIGKEQTPAEYVAALMEVFREVRRVLREDGTCWLNLGDSYWNSTFIRDKSADGWAKKGDEGYNRYYAQNGGGVSGGKRRSTKHPVLKEKDLVGIPWRVAFALQDDGWYLRAEIVWDKGNPMPESIKDRPTKAHEQIFLLTKSPHYYYDADAIKTPVQRQSIKRLGRAVSETHKNYNGAPGQTPHSMFRARPNAKQDGIGNRRYTGFNERYDGQAVPMANARDVWRIHPKGFKGAHFATFPEELVEPMILAGCPQTVCAVCGAPYKRVVERNNPSKYAADENIRDFANNGRTGNPQSSKSLHRQKGGVYSSAICLGFAPTCTCAGATRPGLVLDPFFGAGTVGLVAQRLGRDWLGCDLNPEYVAMATVRIAGHFEEYQAEQAGLPFTPPMFADAAFRDDAP